MVKIVCSGGLSAHAAIFKLLANTTGLRVRQKGSIGISCIGRWCKGKVRNAFSSEGKGPCDYSGGGLFRLNPVEVDFGENNKVGFFEFGKDPKENE